MLMVGMRALQARLVRVGLRIVPVELFFPLPDFIPIGIDQSGQSVENDPFENHQTQALVEEQFPRDSRKRMASADKGQSRLPDRRKLLTEAVEEELVITRATE